MPIPRTYAEWRHCITVSCRIPITSSYVQERLSIWSNPQHEESERFCKLYGERHYQNVIAWFQQAQRELAKLPQP
jgi:hypothetical protein